MEIHKKYAIAFACIVFVLIGAPLAVRFPRGGVGMVITASVVIFALFWASLIGGETLADKGYVSPALAMWLPELDPPPRRDLPGSADLHPGRDGPGRRVG